MDLHLKEKIILVTGGGKGIGEAIVRLIAEEGAVPVILDKDEASSNKIIADIRKGHFIKTDLTSSLACQKAVEEIASRYGRIDGLVNNAGFNDGIGLEKGSPEKFIESMNNNAGHF